MFALESRFRLFVARADVLRLGSSRPSEETVRNAFWIPSGGMHLLIKGVLNLEPISGAIFP